VRWVRALERVNQEVSDGLGAFERDLCARTFRLGEIALLSDALGLQIRRDGKSDEHRQEGRSQPDCEAVAREELARAIAPRIGARKNRHALQVAVDIRGELLDG
jgi:hypothetical protein